MSLRSWALAPILAPILALALVLGAGASLAEEAEDRKARSIAILEAEGVPVLQGLPLIQTEANSTRRSEEEVIQRLLALVIVAVKGETLDQELTQSLIRQFQAEGYFSPWEQAFIDNPNPLPKDRTNATWRYESAAALLWALGLFDLDRPEVIVHVPEMSAVLRDLSPAELRKAAKLRPLAELLDAADLIYRRHWAVRQARLDGQEPPARLSPSVVYERHYALNWLIGYGKDWDDIATDT